MPAFWTARLSASRATFRSIPLPLRLAKTKCFRVGVGSTFALGSVAAELALDADHAVLDVEIADGKSERLTDAQPRGEQQFKPRLGSVVKAPLSIA
jgi:hypothetical protein